MILLLLCSAITVRASTILWASISEKEYQSTGYDSVVTDGENTITVAQFFGDNLVDAMYRIVLPETGTFLDIYCGPENGWQDGEFGLEVISSPNPDTGETSGYLYGHTGTFNADGISAETLVRMEIGLYVWNTDIDEWDVEILAHSNDMTFGSLMGTYTSDSPIPPPTYKDWMPEVFYTYSPVPEPSMFILTLLGVCAILLRRGNAEQV